VSGFSAYTRATKWLYGVLTSPAISGVQGVYEDAAPEGVTVAGDVWIEFEPMTPGQDLGVVGEQRVWTEFPFLVRAITRGRSTKALEAISDAIDSRLHRVEGTTTDGRVLQSTRSSEEQDSWVEAGVEYRALGGIYHLIVQPLHA